MVDLRTWRNHPAVVSGVAVVAAAALGAAIVMLWTSLFCSTRPYDFVDLDYYRAALAVVVAQQPLYAALPYPPAAVFALAWLGGFSAPQGNQLWTAMEIVLVVMLSYLLAARSLVSRRSGQSGYRLVIRTSVAAVLLITSMPVISQIDAGQLSLVVLSLAFVDLARVLPHRWQGTLVGIAGAIKLTPLIFVVYYLVTGQRRQAAVASASFAGMTALGFAVFPADSLFFWMHLGKSDQFGDPARVDNLSIHSLLVRWVPAVGNVSLSWIILGAVVLAIALWRARQHFVRGEWVASVLVVGTAAAIATPITWPHYLIWTVLAGVWLLLLKRRPHVLVGLAILVISIAIPLAFTWRFGSGVFPTGLIGNFAADIHVLTAMLIAVFGLPAVGDRHPSGDRASRSAEAAADPTAGTPAL